MATLTITLPVILKITNIGAHAQSFQPYHENFTVAVPAGVAVELEATTFGQYAYYMKQACEGLTVEKIAEFDVASASIIVIDVPAMVTLTNVSNRVKAFTPYRENFMVDIAAGDSIVLEASSCGQVLYYLAQADADLTVTEAAKA